MTMQWKNAIRISKLKPGKPKMVTMGLKTLMVVKREISSMRLKDSVDTCDGRWVWEERSLMIASDVHCIRLSIDLRMENWWTGRLSRCFPRMENWSVNCPGRRICQSTKQELRVNICKSKSDLIAWVASEAALRAH